jgi:hypothetical protein
MSKDSQSLQQAKFRQQIRISNSGRPNRPGKTMNSERPKQISHRKFELQVRNMEIWPRTVDYFRGRAARQSGEAKTGLPSGKEDSYASPSTIANSPLISL